MDDALDDDASNSGGSDDEASADDAAGGVATRYPHRQRDAAWVEQARSGDDAAFGRLYDAWFDRVFDLTQRIVHNRDIALEVTQDAFLSAWRNLSSLTDPGAFGGWLLRISRNGALNRLQKESRSLPLDDQDFAVMEASGGSPSHAPAGFALEDRLAAETDPVRALEDAETRDLVWQAAAALGARDTEVLDLQLRHGLSPAEVGEVLGLNRNAANQLVHRVRGRFEVALRARLLWRNDKPACAELARVLASAGVQNFSVEAVKIADKHAPSCPDCSERRRSRVAPAAMFGAIPVMAAPIAFKQSAAYALENAGVPMAGSAYGSAASAPLTDGADGSSGSGQGGDAGGPDGPTTPTGASRARLRVGRRGLVMAGVAVLVVVGLFAVAAGRATSPANNEVVALASGAVETTPTGVGLPGPTGTTVGEPPSTTPSPEESGLATDPASPDPSAGPTSPPTTATKVGPPNPTVTLVAGPAPDPTETTPPAGPDPSTPSPSVSALPGPTTPIAGPVTPIVSAELGVSPNPARQTFPIDPVQAGATPIVSWKVSGTGIVGVKVSGPGLSSTAFAGSEAVCPSGRLVDFAGGKLCGNAIGTHTYRLEVVGAGFAVIATRTVVLALR